MHMPVRTFAQSYTCHHETIWLECLAIAVLGVRIDRSMIAGLHALFEQDKEARAVSQCTDLDNLHDTLRKCGEYVPAFSRAFVAVRKM